MDRALVEAEQAATLGEVPIGAVVVSPFGELWGAGGNRVEQYTFQGEHAEARAIRAATEHVGNWRLTGATLYVTLEPCMMCVSLIALSRIERIVYGASSPLFGYRLDNEGVLALYTKQIKNITAGVRAEEAARLLQTFFSTRRGRTG